MPYEKRRGGIIILVCICILRRDDDAETNEKIGAACRSGLGVDDHIVVCGNAVPDPGAQLRREIVGGMKFN